MEIGIAEILHYNKNTRKPNNEHVTGTDMDIFELIHD